jgi:hypothetical protein
MASQMVVLTDEQQETMRLMIESREKFELENRNPKSRRDEVPTYTTKDGKTFLGWGKVPHSVLRAKITPASVSGVPAVSDAAA